MSSSVALLATVFVSCLSSAAVLGYLARCKVAGLRRWLAAHCLFAVASGVLFLVHARPSAAVMLASCMLVLGGALLMLQGCRAFVGKPPCLTGEHLALGVCVGAVMYWTWESPNVSARAAVMSFALAYARIAVGWTLWSSRVRERPQYGHWLVLCAALVGGIVYFARGVLNAFFADPAISWPTHVAPDFAFLGISILSLPLLSIGLVMVANDRLMQQVEKLATFDELTGALVRRAFMIRGTTLSQTARAARTELCVAIIDIDDFKTINDRHGHATGDRVLADFGAEVHRHMRAGDVFGRLGGEEFAILFPQTSMAEAARLVGSMLAAVSCPQPAAKGKLTYAFSAGINECAQAESLSDALAGADAMLYRAKRAGKCRIELAQTERASHPANDMARSAY
ncbi:MAG: COG3706: Response regulator containing a CheY-like receiver domain and a GGDEF domain [uncultured Paraburkholderia sp.]|uniref:GGDEF domain-containing protein n=1 Tax=uncultured Paraburkholderia sp. TaxID=1822466 RepID=UPI0025956A05|nr:GGDEF domain-containing protein [uncultured Paraburkholderia sp.]CAH2899049.1 MAG: COG3706: Response regulator containing a CheY-like receiver domain and a GGDEF domain [uncultured Paraburkholderia sp.]CAH2924853.1 MAG: COG3706: Response regulator containing a CheY-like receiver domain and a GGDEF domain [uncultured Paraburkholderia sp.]